MTLDIKFCLNKTQILLEKTLSPVSFFDFLNVKQTPLLSINLLLAARLSPRHHLLGNNRKLPTVSMAFSTLTDARLKNIFFFYKMFSLYERKSKHSSMEYIDALTYEHKL